MTTLLGLPQCKMHKVHQFILVIIIMGLLYIICPDRFLWDNIRLGIQRDGSGETEVTAYNLTCKELHSLGNKTECEEGVHNHLNSTGLNETNNRNELSERKAGLDVDKKNKTLAMGVGVDVRAVFKPFSDRVLQTKVGEDVSISSALYREIPPVYDDLIKVTMDTKQQCKNASEYSVIIAVHTAPTNFKNRAAYRWLYGDFAKTKPRRYKLIFFIGLVSNSTLQDLLKKENEQHDDMVQGNYIDAYINMTYKAIMVFDYLDKYCKGMHAFFRVDDDVFMNMEQVLVRWSYVQRIHPAKAIMCFRITNGPVMRWGKWAVPRSLIPQNTYAFARCPGYFAAISVDLIHAMNEQVRKMPFFWIDDIVMLGLVPKSIPGVFLYPLNKWMTPRTRDFENCVQRLGSNCHWWIGLSHVEHFEKLYGYVSGRIPLIK